MIDSIKKISVQSYNLLPVSEIQPEIFDSHNILRDLELTKKHEKISSAMDKFS